MHGDFLAEQIDERLVGGVSLLSGYVNKVRREEKNVPWLPGAAASLIAAFKLW